MSFPLEKRMNETWKRFHRISLWARSPQVPPVGLAWPLGSVADDAALWACPVGVSIRFLTLGPSVTGRPLSPPPPPSFDMCPAVGCDSYFFRWLCLCVRRFLDAVMAGVTSVHVTSVGLRQSTGWLCLYKTTDKMIGLISGGRRENLNKISAL